MCGIVGYKGNQNSIPVLLNGLKSLEYRGYDSAGLAYINGGKIIIKKAIGRVKNLENLVTSDDFGSIGIAHTRWATHGGVTDKNAHPHKQGKITLVHNGIIENYKELSEKIDTKLLSETDTEILCAYINKLYNENHDMLKTLAKLKTDIKGSYALAIINKDEPDTLYGVRKNIPLILAKNDNEYFLVSDMTAALKYTNKFYLLENDEIVKISDKEYIYDSDLNLLKKELLTFEGTSNDVMLKGYPHFMLKEIHEEPMVINNILFYYLTDGKFNENMPEFKKYKNIYFVGCGSASYTADIAKKVFENYANIKCEVFLASEFRYQKHFYDKDTLVVFISQSGETADTLEALRITKSDGIDTLAIVNVVGSSIAREAGKVLYIKAGTEIAVATTKAFTAQYLLLTLIALKMAGINDLSKFYKINEALETVFAIDFQKYAEKIYTKKDAFFIGRGIDYGLCEEGSLKLKEISYINSSAFASGELKHGTISLIEKDTPVMGIITDENLALKTISNIKEVHARGAYSLFITSLDIDGDFYDDKIKVPHINDYIDPILIVASLQLLAYNVALLKGEDIDKPRNLAKSVTVE
jgi:glucosamine--fructose-6-phosphate aminotransferase (isomerizing)